MVWLQESRQELPGLQAKQRLPQQPEVQKNSIKAVEEEEKRKCVYLGNDEGRNVENVGMFLFWKRKKDI